MLHVLRSGLAVSLFSPSGRDLIFDPRSGDVIALGTGLTTFEHVNISLICVYLRPRSGLQLLPMIDLSAHNGQVVVMVV